ncbi:hypothetical protein D5086_032762 [Populus alba]|uniref:Uncharacterized protein n=1 Tax=Populus alba TaxID=43335 RepID=A0ACC4AF00_POPAL
MSLLVPSPCHIVTTRTRSQPNYQRVTPTCEATTTTITSRIDTGCSLMEKVLPNREYLYWGVAVDGVPHGRGSIVFKVRENGHGYDTFIGVDDRKGSIGVYWNEYVSEWKHGVISKKGVLVCANGKRYEGYWENGVPKGKGMFTFGSGNVNGRVLGGGGEDS